MKKITFENLPSTKTPVNSSNLNQVQNNIENVFNGEESMGSIVVEDVTCKNLFAPLKSMTASGITITQNPDDTYNISGTNTSSNAIECTVLVDLDTSHIKNGETYTLSSNKQLPNGLSSRVEMFNEGNWVRGFVPSINSTTPTNSGVANTTNINKIRFGIFISSGATINIQNVGFQLEKGSVATNYVEHKEFSNKQIYSTNEQRIGTWIDGKPLYRKVINFGALPNTTSKSVAHGISNIDYIVDIRSTAALPGGDTMKLDVSDKDGLKFSVHISANNTNITVLTGSDRSVFTRCYVTLEYTKTTDGVSTTSLE